MSAFFYPTYQFIPVTGEIDGKKIRQNYELIKQGRATEPPNVRHDLWVDSSCSGRIICSVYLNSPTVVGNRHVTDSGSGKKRIEQYQWQGQPALPASSLRGVVSSMVEALSQSTLRVLNIDENKQMRVLDRRSPERDDKSRVRVPNTVHQYFDHIDQDMKPWQAAREQLTVAEMLFGVVEVNEKDSEKNGGDNLRGRLRFSDARAIGEIKQLAEITLQLLGEPKTPCPSMYYHLKGHRGEYLSKEQMFEYANNQSIVPNGRKYYIHHPEAQRRNNPWETRGNKAQEKNKFLCRPMQSGQTFYFTIDFENLSAAELTLLYTAIQPDEYSQHRLGLGKPLGLGSVTIKPEGVFFVDRKTRYGLDSLSVRRYQSAWITGGKNWHALYPTEANMESDSIMPDALSDTQYIDKETLGIAQTLCNPKYVQDYPVRTPILSSQEASPEEKTYEWFNQNDHIGNQAMPVITPHRDLPFLYADMTAARNSGRFCQVEISAFSATAERETISETPDVLSEFLAGMTDPVFEEILKSRDLAEYIRDKVPEENRVEVFEWLIPLWVKFDIILNNPVEKIYDKLYPGWRQKRTELFKL